MTVGVRQSETEAPPRRANDRGHGPQGGNAPVSTSQDTCHDPSAEVLCRFPRKLLDELGTDWHECAAFRFVIVSEDEVGLEFTNDLERATAPVA